MPDDMKFARASNISSLMKCLIGRKTEMTQVFRADGTVVPVTLVETGPCFITDLKTTERDGYQAIVVGFGKAKHVAKPQRGQWKDLGSFEEVREFRMNDLTGYEIGQAVELSQFIPGDRVTVVGTSKGRGFQGVVKRHGFHGQSTTHGTKDQVRMPGSLGAGGVQRVFLGMRMGGRMGQDRVSVQNLEIVEVRPTEGILAIKGALPGSRHSVVMIQSA